MSPTGQDRTWQEIKKPHGADAPPVPGRKSLSVGIALRGSRAGNASEAQRREQDMTRFRYLVDFHARTFAINLYFTGSNNNLFSAKTPPAAFLPRAVAKAK
ncbi:MAG: hypothetical protein ABR911_08105 [Syntrophales bacterium]